MTVTGTLTKAIKERIAERGFKKSVLARECGLTNQGITNICNGMPMRTSTLDKLFNTLGLEIVVKVKES